MKIGILFDILILALLGYGYVKGYKRGVVTMFISLASFIVGAISIKTIGTATYLIFGDSLEEATRNYLLRKIPDTEVITVIFQQMLYDSLIKKVVQIICFMITYVVAGAIVGYILKTMRFSINNSFLNSMDKNFGGVVGVMSSLISIFLILGIFSILMTANKESFLVTMVDTSYVGAFLYKINPLRLLLG